MSYDLNIIVRALPKDLKTLWVDEFRKIGMNVRLSNDFIPESDSGFLLMEILDEQLEVIEEQGFEFSISEFKNEEIFSEEKTTQMNLERINIIKNMKINILMSGDDEEFMKKAAVALAMTTNGIIINPQEGITYFPDEVNKILD